jgi:quinol-cytochrome oxidoreductase complex cytochrome b subunit
MNFIVFLCANDLLFYSVLEVLSYEFNYGFILELVFVTQIVSGVFLTCFFLADSECAYDSIVFIVRNIYGG